MPEAGRTETASGTHGRGSVDVPEPEEAGDVGVTRVRPEVVRRRRLHDSALAHDGDAVAERERFRLIVGDVDRGQGELVEELFEILEEAVAQPPVERAERLVQKEHARLGRESTREGHALTLAAGQRSDGAVLEAVEADEPEQVTDPTPMRSGGSPRMRSPNATFPKTSRCGKSA